uniref:Uncharacterized protein n=1 Tax=Anguilla anguilla TaxID=7936 RepID=A0A0E9U1Q5_ANGAN
MNFPLLVEEVERLPQWLRRVCVTLSPEEKSLVMSLAAYL